MKMYPIKISTEKKHFIQTTSDLSRENIEELLFELLEMDGDFDRDEVSKLPEGYYYRYTTDLKDFTLEEMKMIYDNILEFWNLASHPVAVSFEKAMKDNNRSKPDPKQPGLFIEYNDGLYDDIYRSFLEHFFEEIAK